MSVQRERGAVSSFPFRPKVVGWELTLRCNMRCLHCGSSAGEARPDELTEPEGLKLIDDLVDLGAEVVTLSGGEPLLHPSWPVYARRLAGAGVQVFMITNGLLLEAQAAEVRAAGVNSVGVSLDGAGATHDRIRAHPGSFERALSGLRAARAAGLRAGAVTHVSGLNLGELGAMHRVLADLPADFWQIQLAFSQGRMKEHAELTLPPERLPEVIDFIAAAQRAGGAPTVVPGDNVGYYCEPPIHKRPWKGCFAGRHVLGIEADGSIKGCLSLPRDFVEGNVRQESLRAIWEDEGRFRYNRYFSVADLRGGCASCPKGDPCRAGCVVTAFAATGERFDNPYCLLRQRRLGGG